MLDVAIQKVPSPSLRRTELLEAQVDFEWLHQRVLENRAQRQPGLDEGEVQTTPAAVVVPGLRLSSDAEVNLR